MKEEDKEVKNEDFSKIEMEEKKENREEQVPQKEVIDKENTEVNIEEKIEKSDKSNNISIKNEYIKEKEDRYTNNINKQKAKHNKAKKISNMAIILIILSIIILLFLSTIFAILNINNSNVIKGVYIENVNISNLSKEEISDIVNKKIGNIEDIELKFGEYSTIAKLEELGIEIYSKETITEAINLGRTNNIIIDNYAILKTMLFKTKLELDIRINENKFNDAIKNIQAEIPEAIKEYSYEIKGEELIITNGKTGEKIVSEELKNRIINNVKNQFNGETETVQIPTKIANPEAISIDKIYNEIHKEAKNAYVIEEPFELHKEENGIDFAITIDEAKEIIKVKKDTYTIPLKVTKPEVEIKDLGDKLFKQTLAKYTTIYDAGNTNRSHNIALAAKTINGTILLPGETFSYNGVLGNTNKEKGYKLGTAYVNGKVVESYGGGICQVSSTLYNSVLYANLEIVERYNHSYVVNYVPAGRDATVAYGGKDFKFKNTRSYPIKIVASAKNGVVSISIMGIKEEIEYEVVLTSTVLSTTKRNVLYENNSNLEEGTQKVIQKGYDGKKSIAYKIIKYNGKTISKTVLSKDTYKPMNQIIQVGTKKVTSTVTTPVTTTPTTNVQ